MKKSFLIALLFLMLTAAAVYMGLFSPIRLGGIPEEHRFKVSGKEILLTTRDDTRVFTPRGVNLGTGYPGIFPNEFGIPEEVYYRWFRLIGGMHANTIRVYKLQSPAFYNALWQYNRDHPKKLYLIQGIDFPDQKMYSTENPADQQNMDALLRQTQAQIRVLHGDGLILQEEKLFLYTKDVSPYVMGYLPGVEWDEMFIEFVCRIHNETKYQGEYVECSGTGFECFLARWGDGLLRYEDETYHTQKLLSFANWPATDPLRNEFEITGQQLQYQIPDCEAGLDMEHLHPGKKMESGLFASYNVYPYFPYFLQMGKYTGMVDRAGTRNPYGGYLRDINRHHSCPVVITEYGIPASRSTAYEDIWFGMNHGGLSETEQGQALVKLHRDIEEAGCAGSILFTWQDEWYKTAWNEGMLSDPDRRAFWSNAQCPEQCFGLLAFEPGDADTQPYPDGNLQEWDETEAMAFRDGLSLSMQSDEKYLYFLIEGDAAESPFHIALDVLPEMGLRQTDSLTFLRDVDFLIAISPPDQGILLTCSQESLRYSALGGYDDTSVYMAEKIVLSGKHGFHPVQRAKGNIHHTRDGDWIPENTGLLTPGNGNPESERYNSLADFFCGDHSVEIRIPWQLLDFCDPSTARVLDYSHPFSPSSRVISGIYACPVGNWEKPVREFGFYALEPWKEPRFHERLKESYRIIQEEFHDH